MKINLRITDSPDAGLTPANFQIVRELIQENFGMKLEDRYMTQYCASINENMLALNVKSFNDYYLKLTRYPDALAELASLLSTNHTYFFRHPEQDRLLTNTILPALKKRGETTGQRTLNIWSAACSTGEEVYSVLILLHEFFGAELKRWQLNFTASDICDKALIAANAGCYEKSAMAGIQTAMRQRYFEALPLEPFGAPKFAIKPEIRKLPKFKKINLMSERFPFCGKLDIIYCRNVMIYFTQPTIEDLFDRLANHLAVGGYLFKGNTENPARQDQKWRRVAAGVLQRV